MNIAIGKLSKSLQFDKEYRKTGKGDLAPMACYISLAKRYPRDKFYLIGTSDFQKSATNESLRKDNGIPANIIDLSAIAKERFKKDQKNTKPVGFGAILASNKDSWTHHEHYCEYIVDVINEQNIKFDYGIFFLGPDCSNVLPWCYSRDTYKKTGKKQMLKILQMSANYTAPIVNAINTFKFPYIFVNEDPRYVPMASKDILWPEACYLSHLTKDCEVQRMEGYYDDSLKLKSHTEHFMYSGIERTSLLFLKKYDFRNKDGFEIDGRQYKKDGFLFVACNESPSRFANIKSWILDKYDNVPIYGKWADDTIKGYESRFINKPMAYLQDEMWRAKYTYIPGFFDKMTNFVTIKIWEMCIYGILPFFDKTKYDTDKCVPVPEFLRCSSPGDMKSKIEMLEKDPDLYQKYLNDIYELVSDDYFNGKFICKIFDPIFRKDPSSITIDDWRENSRSLLAEYSLEKK